MPVDQRLRGMYDQRTDGRIAPHTDFVSVGEAKKLFGAFAAVRVERHNFDDYRLRRLQIKRDWFIGNLDRLLGLDLYILARK
jgi:hypothetical protein